MEVWRQVPGHPTYEVSTLGRIRRHGKHVLKGNRSRKNYRQVALYPGCVRTYIHVIVARVFLGDPPPGHEVNHKDCDPANNAVANLEWVTHYENMHYAMRLGRLDNSGEKNVHAKLTWPQVREIRARHARGETVLPAEYGVASDETIRRVVTNFTWRERAA